MSAPIKTVIDTNIWVSALLSPGNPREIVYALAANKFVLVCSNELLAELIHVLSRQKFAVTISSHRMQRIIALIWRKAVFVEPSRITAMNRDPKDDVFLACAISSKCQFLVTGDKDLYSLGECQNVKIISSREFLELLMQKA